MRWRWGDGGGDGGDGGGDGGDEGGDIRVLGGGPWHAHWAYSGSEHTYACTGTGMGSSIESTPITFRSKGMVTNA